jgi:hypothetical protein
MNDERNKQVLRKFYDFDDADLYANRQGQFSEKQLQVIQSVRDARGKGAKIINVFFVLMGSVSLGFSALILLVSSTSQKWYSGMVAVMIMGIVIGLASFGVGNSVMKRSQRKVHANYVLRTSQGIVHLTSIQASAIGSHGHKDYYREKHMQIGDAEFVLDEDIDGRIKEG